MGAGGSPRDAKLLQFETEETKCAGGIVDEQESEDFRSRSRRRRISKTTNQKGCFRCGLRKGQVCQSPRIAESGVEFESDTEKSYASNGIATEKSPTGSPSPTCTSLAMAVLVNTKLGKSKLTGVNYGILESGYNISAP